MKKLLLILVVVVLGTGVSYAIDPKYKGYADFTQASQPLNSTQI